MRNIICTVLLALLGASKPNDKDKTYDKPVTDYVNPFIGTADANFGPKGLADNFSAGNVIPGAVVPWGMVNISPHNTFEVNSEGKAGRIPSGYEFGNNTLCGFGQIHLSGVGCHDWGNLIVMPKIGKVSSTLPENKSRYNNEKASSGYYSLHILGDEIDTEVSATTRTTITRYTFNKKTDSLKIIFDLYQNIIHARDGYIKITSDTTVEGWILNGGFCGSTTL